MANRKLFNSKNIVYLIETLLSQGKEDLVVNILNSKELKGLTPNILQILSRKNIKLKEYDSTKIYSKTELRKEVLESLSSKLDIDTKGAKIIIDENMSAGVKIKSRSRLIDATLSTMLEKGIKELLAD